MTRLIAISLHIGYRLQVGGTWWRQWLNRSVSFSISFWDLLSHMAANIWHVLPDVCFQSFSFGRAGRVKNWPGHVGVTYVPPDLLIKTERKFDRDINKKKTVRRSNSFLFYWGGPIRHLFHHLVGQCHFLLENGALSAQLSRQEVKRESRIACRRSLNRSLRVRRLQTRRQKYHRLTHKLL